MTDRQLLAIKYTWSYIIQESEEAGAFFYQKLFEIDPALRPLFRNDMELQISKLMRMVTMIVSRLQDLETLAGEINALAMRHVGYGAKPEDYAKIGQALMWTLEKGLGDRWTPETREAWELMYHNLSQAMLAATYANSNGSIQ